MSQVTVTKKGNGTAAVPREAIRSATYTPRVDILAGEEEVVVFAEVPGVRPGEIDVRFEKGELAIHARCAPRQGEVRFLVHEYGVGDFSRTFTVSENIDPAGIAAELKDGLLVLRLPRAEAVKPRKIPVRGG